jgi:hypothetical protein
MHLEGAFFAFVASYGSGRSLETRHEVIRSTLPPECLTEALKGGLCLLRLYIMSTNNRQVRHTFFSHRDVLDRRDRPALLRVPPHAEIVRTIVMRLPNISNSPALCLLDHITFPSS